MSKKELQYLFENAPIVNIDDTSKLVFISDNHRGDGTYFDSLLPNRNIYTAALKYYFKNDFTYVEVGDGDELWKNKNFNEIAYEYLETFSILNEFKKKNRVYMLYGNHDIIKRKKNFFELQKSKLKSDYGNGFLEFIHDIRFYEAITFMYKPLKKKFLVTHGHQCDFFNNELWYVNMFLLRYLWKFMYGIAGFKDPTSSAKSNTRRSFEDIKLQNWSEETGNMLICGHSHNSRFPKISEPPYFNDGCCVLPYAMTSIEIEGGNISLIKWQIDTKETGDLFVRRIILEGPSDISPYLNWNKDK